MRLSAGGGGVPDGLLDDLVEATGLPVRSLSRIAVRSRSSNFMAICADGRKYAVKFVPRGGGIVRVGHPVVARDAFPDRTFSFGDRRFFVLDWLEGVSRRPESLTRDECRNLLATHASFCEAVGQGRIHGDFNFKNVLFDGGRVSGILDLEGVRRGHPCEDLVRFILTGADRIPFFRFARRRALMDVFRWMVADGRFPVEAWSSAMDAHAAARRRRRGGALKRFSRIWRESFYVRLKAFLTSERPRCHLGWSSMVYRLEVGDLASLPDYGGTSFSVADLPSDEVILFIGPGERDSILRGRAKIAEAMVGGDVRSRVPVRIVFRPSIAKWNLPATVIRVFRNRFKYRCTGVYHMSARDIRAMGLERAIRSRETAYRVGGLRLTDERRNELFDGLCESLRRGFDDRRPLTVMLCRASGMRDSLDQGHHRMSACIECGVDRVAVRFSAAGAIPMEIVPR